MAFLLTVHCFIQLFPGRPHVVKLLETLQEWLVSMPLDKIPYDAILDLVNNKMRVRHLCSLSHWFIPYNVAARAAP